MGTGYQMFSKMHPAGGIYRYKGDANKGNPWQLQGWKIGKIYLLTKWETPAGISDKSPILNAFFLVNGEQRCVDMSFFRYLDQIVPENT